MEYVQNNNVCYRFTENYKTGFQHPYLLSVYINLIDKKKISIYNK